MRKLLWVVVVAGLAWSGYWVLGSRGAESATQDWLEDRREDGWQVEYADLEVKGFPNRFDTTITDIDLTDPETGWSWKAPFFQLFALSYQPNHLIAVWPNEQTLATPFQKVQITSQDMRASLVIKPGAALELDRANMTMDDARFASTDGWTAGFNSLNAAIRTTEGVENSYDIAFDADAVTPGERFQSWVDKTGQLPTEIEAVTLDTVVSFAGPLDRRTIEDRRPDITNLKINDARGTWGELALRAIGEVQVDAEGYPTGEVTLTARNWRQMLALSVEAGAIGADAARAAEFALGLLAGVSGGGESLDAPLSFSGRKTYLGPIPIGAAPRINLR